MRPRLTRVDNRIAVELYRRFDGPWSSGREDVYVLLLTVPGRSTGRTPLDLRSLPAIP